MRIKINTVDLYKKGWRLEGDGEMPTYIEVEGEAIVMNDGVMGAIPTSKLIKPLPPQRIERIILAPREDSVAIDVLLDKVNEIVTWINKHDGNPNYL